jgi:hypothetical protein
MATSDDAACIVGCGIISVGLLSVIGYIMNIIAIINYGPVKMESLDGEFIIRVVGIFVPFVGSFMGFFGYLF